MFFKYFLFTMFFVFLVKSAMRGFTSELISLVFTTIAAVTALVVYKPGMKYALASIAIFCVIQAIGLYVAFSNKRSGNIQMLGGIALGIFKFFLLLMVATSIVVATNLAAPEFMEQTMIQVVLPYASSISWVFEKLA